MRRGEQNFPAPRFFSRCGYVLQSNDNGQRWRELTGELERAYGGGFGPVTRCAYAGGALIVGGADLYATIVADAL